MRLEADALVDCEIARISVEKFKNQYFPSFIRFFPNFQPGTKRLSGNFEEPAAGDLRNNIAM